MKIKIPFWQFLLVLAAGLVMAALGAFVTGLIVMLLWNWLLTALFGFKEISWIQGWGLAFLSSILFKSSVASSK